MSSIPSADAKAVVRAIEGLTTQVRRAVDAYLTPVVQYEVADDDDATTTCAHRGPHPGFACAEVDASQPYFRVRWDQEQQAPSGPPPHVPDHTAVEHCPACTWEQRAPAADDQVSRWARREPLLVLLTRLQRGRTLTAAEADTLRHLVETEMREAALADQTRAEAQRDRDQHATVLREVLAAFVDYVPGYRIPRRSAEVDVVTLDKWRSVVAPTVEQPWWQQVAQYEQAAVEATQHVLELKAAIRKALDICGDQGSDVQNILRAALDGTEQPTTEA